MPMDNYMQTQAPPMGGVPPSMPALGSNMQPAVGLPPQIQQLLQMVAQGRQMQNPNIDPGHEVINANGQPNTPNPLQAAAAQGRNGDTTIAHLTPGEKTVPPEVQTPKVLATLNKAYKDKGVNPQQFTVGSPQSSVNPSTGLNEYNFLSAFLPAALGIAGGFLAPELLPSLSPLLASSIGGGIGTTAGGLAAGQTPLQAGLSGLGSGLGGYELGKLAGVGADAASSGVANVPAHSMGANLAQQAAQTPSPSMWNLYGNLDRNINPAQAIGSTVGGAAGSYFGRPIKPPATPYPPGFTDHMPSVASLPSAQAQLGQNVYKGPLPTFTNYNPATNYPTNYNFFPNAGS